MTNRTTTVNTRRRLPFSLSLDAEVMQAACAGLPDGQRSARVSTLLALGLRAEAAGATDAVGLVLALQDALSGAQRILATVVAAATQEAHEARQASEERLQSMGVLLTQLEELQGRLESLRGAQPKPEVRAEVRTEVRAETRAAQPGPPVAAPGTPAETRPKSAPRIFTAMAGSPKQVTVDEVIARRPASAVVTLELQELSPAAPVVPLRVPVSINADPFGGATGMRPPPMLLCIDAAGVAAREPQDGPQPEEAATPAPSELSSAGIDQLT